jgi:hypothetical protein
MYICLFFGFVTITRGMSAVRLNSTVITICMSAFGPELSDNSSFLSLIITVLHMWFILI